MTDDNKKTANPEQPEQGDASADAPTILVGEVHSLAEYTDVIQQIHKSIVVRNFPLWFRGHADAEQRLAPSIFRPDLLGDNPTDERIKELRTAEVETNINFRHHAKAREPKFPHDDDQVGQLVVARHHGLLSRLLDWSESPLTALFFAVEGGGCEPKPACVWIFVPSEFNVRQWNECMIYYSHARVPKAIARCAFNHEEVLEEISLKELDTSKRGVVAAFKPQHTIMRHMVQKAQFTIHHTPDELSNLPDADKFVSKIIIPFDKREGILDELRSMGVSRDLLFPDLDNLAMHQNAEIKRRME